MDRGVGEPKRSCCPAGCWGRRRPWPGRGCRASELRRRCYKLLVADRRAAIITIPVKPPVQGWCPLCGASLGMAFYGSVAAPAAVSNFFFLGLFGGARARPTKLRVVWRGKGKPKLGRPWERTTSPIAAGVRFLFSGQTEVPHSASLHSAWRGFGQVWRDTGGTDILCWEPLQYSGPLKGIL